jgi:polygalacturonase
MTRTLRLLFLITVFCTSLTQAGRAAAMRTSLNVREFGAIGDGKTKDTAAFQKSLDACLTAGGGEVLVPAGDYLIGSIELKSNTTLRLSKDAHLIGSPDLEDYPVTKVRWEGRWVDGHRGLVYAQNAHHIAIIGPGKISGSSTLGGRQMPRRPVVIEPINSTDIRLEDFSTEQRLMWSIHLTTSDNIVIRNLTIRATGGNGDGIDVDSCKHVRIEFCDIDTGDDAIAIKSGRGMEGYREARTTDDVLISNCILGDSNFAGIGIGSETSGGIRNVRIEHVKFTHVKTFAVYIKSREGRGAFIENISANDLDAPTAPAGFLRINVLNSGLQDSEPVPGDEGIPLVKNISFSNIKVNCGTLVDAVSTSPVKPIQGFSLTNVTGTCSTGASLANMTNARLRNINVKGVGGPLIKATNVQPVPH